MKKEISVVQIERRLIQQITFTSSILSLTGCQGIAIAAKNSRRKWSIFSNWNISHPANFQFASGSPLSTQMRISSLSREMTPWRKKSTTESLQSKVTKLEEEKRKIEISAKNTEDNLEKFKLCTMVHYTTQLNGKDYYMCPNHTHYHNW